MQSSLMSALPAVKPLSDLAHRFLDPSCHLKHLLTRENRFEALSLSMDDFFYDYSKQRLDNGVMDHLYALASQAGASEKFSAMVKGHRVNTTEKRPALHTAARDLEGVNPVMVDGLDVNQAFHAINDRIRQFSDAIRSGALTGSTGKPFSRAVVVGIGGSYLGCEFLYTALGHYARPDIQLDFLANVDIHSFGRVTRDMDPESCLWIVISKSYTTTETMANLAQVEAYIKARNLDPSDHLITVTAKGSPGDNPANPALASFNMFDFIGGRYSVTSAVGGLPLSLAFGYDVFSRLLKGCHVMDCHALNTPAEQNMPLTAALISIWNSFFLNYAAQAVIPYSQPLEKLGSHVQQLYMESLGKAVTDQGEPLNYHGGVILFGEPGTNAQHSFFQLAHQGRAFPVDFIGVVSPAWEGKQVHSKGVSNHQELWANMMAQARALAIGQTNPSPERSFPGNRPSSTMLIPDLSPESLGRLLSFYEARTVFEGFVLGVNPFDQFGVELGKTTASGIRECIKQKNRDPDHGFDGQDPASRFYLQTLFRGAL